MSSLPASPELFDGVNPDHIGLLDASLRAPSAHNAQPWQIKPLPGDSYELHYDQHPGLPHDRDDKDAYLTMGALVETMTLEAPNYGLNVTVAPELTRDGRDIFIGSVTISDLVEKDQADPLSVWIDKRVTNRNRYLKDPLTPELEQKLKDLGNVVVDSELLAPVVLEASMESWGDPQFVHDLKMWLRKRSGAEDGLTAASMNLGRAELVALDFAFRRGSLNSRLMRYLFSSSEVAMFKSAPNAAVLTAPDMSPASLFDAGRRLLRSWVTITGAGFSSQPYSVAVDQESTIPKVGEIAEAEFPVALYRVGKAATPPRVSSNRKPLSEVLISRD